MNKVERLAWHAMNMTESDEIKAEACYILARYFHFNRDYEKAFKYYYQATTLNHPTFVLPQYGLGQLYIMRGEYNQERQDKAREMLSKVLEATPNDVEVLIDLAQLLEGVDPHRSLTLYESACDLIKTSEDGYLRLGCLARDRGQIYESSVWFKEAMSVDQNNADSWVLIGNLHMSKHE
ncbi:unnamed protein product [Strongylus vulgaris]|uniref:Uncharacterized protein n=1 Tax=Strongylus vulgaris TaxID=40348 RepID=A0A3P7LR45_STRVU|nr:unnamed protein product [Strongylus vulgaris]